VLVVDAANVVGSRPNGWWRDRAGAARDLCAGLTAAVHGGRLDAPVVAVLEGAARRGVAETDGEVAEADGGRPGSVRIVHAAASGDDTIAALVAEMAGGGENVTVVTADRGLADRVRRAGGEVVRPGWLLDRLGES
jgi:hypothetical protein